MAWDGSAERRRHRRANIRLVVEFAGKDEVGRDQVTRIETLNLSAGGFYARSNREVPELTRLGIGFVFPPFGEHRAGHTVECEAIVVRCNPEGEGTGAFRLAACFVDLPTAEGRLIDEFVAWHEFVYSDDVASDEQEEAAGR